jgi:hypothetical protein
MLQLNLAPHFYICFASSPRIFCYHQYHLDIHLQHAVKLPANGNEEISDVILIRRGVIECETGGRLLVRPWPLARNDRHHQDDSTSYGDLYLADCNQVFIPCSQYGVIVKAFSGPRATWRVVTGHLPAAKCCRWRQFLEVDDD